MDIGDFFLVLNNLTIQFVCQQINRGIHVAVFAMCMKIMALDVQTRFHFVNQFIYAHDGGYVNNMVEVTFNPIKLG